MLQLCFAVKLQLHFPLTWRWEDKWLKNSSLGRVYPLMESCSVKMYLKLYKHTFNGLNMCVCVWGGAAGQVCTSVWIFSLVIIVVLYLKPLFDRWQWRNARILGERRGSEMGSVTFPDWSSSFNSCWYFSHICWCSVVLIIPFSSWQSYISLNTFSDHPFWSDQKDHTQPLFSS